LALAAQAAHAGTEHLVVGKPMEFWRRNMPKGMYLRSASDWHLDPINLHTIEAFLQSQGKTTGDVEPLSLDFYLSYAEWFQQEKNIRPLPVYIRQLDYDAITKEFVAITQQEQEQGQVVTRSERRMSYSLRASNISCTCLMICKGVFRRAASNTPLNLLISAQHVTVVT